MPREADRKIYSFKLAARVKSGEMLNLSFMNLKPIITLAVCCVFNHVAKAQQSPRFIFLDSLMNNISPVPPALAMLLGLKKTESFTVSGTKSKDTTFRIQYFYDQHGRTSRSTAITRKGDTIHSEFTYDTTWRLVHEMKFFKGWAIQESTWNFTDSTSVCTIKNGRGKLLSTRVSYHNHHRQLVQSNVYDSSKNLVEAIHYDYDDRSLPVKVQQTSSRGRLFRNEYEHRLEKGNKVLRIYEVYGSFRRLVEKVSFNRQELPAKTNSYDFYTKEKRFSSEAVYNEDGTIRLYKGVYHYSGYAFIQHFSHHTH